VRKRKISPWFTAVNRVCKIQLPGQQDPHRVGAAVRARRSMVTPSIPGIRRSTRMTANGPSLRSVSSAAAPLLAF